MCAMWLKRALQKMVKEAENVTEMLQPFVCIRTSEGTGLEIISLLTPSSWTVSIAGLKQKRHHQTAT